MKVKPPCKGCSLRQVGCRSTCQRWAIYEKEKEAEKAVVTAERNRYLGILDAEIKRKAAEKRKKRKR